jgi:hypothetical protein
MDEIIPLKSQALSRETIKETEVHKMEEKGCGCGPGMGMDMMKKMGEGVGGMPPMMER